MACPMKCFNIYTQINMYIGLFQYPSTLRVITSGYEFLDCVAQQVTVNLQRIIIINTHTKFMSQSIFCTMPPSMSTRATKSTPGFTSTETRLISGLQIIVLCCCAIHTSEYQISNVTIHFQVRKMQWL